MTDNKHFYSYDYWFNNDKHDDIIKTLLSFNSDIICLQEVFEDPLKNDIIDSSLSEITTLPTTKQEKIIWVNENYSTIKKNLESLKV